MSWQAGQHQPDALAALVIAHDILAHAVGQRVTFASPLDAERRMRHREPGVRFAQRDPATVTSMSGYLSRRIDGADGYDPLAYLRTARR